MDLIKQYIVQSLSAASNNLRLNTQKIEVVALLRETIIKSTNLEADIKKMKKITEFSTLAIRLNEIHNYLTQSNIDFFKLSEKFKEHSQYLIKDLSHMLDMVNPGSFKIALDKMKEAVPPAAKMIEIGEDKDEEISLDLSKRKTDESTFQKSESDVLKENFILEEDKNDEETFFENFEETILKPIKPIDTMLKQLAENKFDNEEMLKYSDIMKTNGDISEKVGFEIIANMHKIVSKSLLLINAQELMPGKEVIESLRSCLIVIVAVVKGKEVDITNYLNRAEEFGRKIQNIKAKDFI